MNTQPKHLPIDNKDVIAELPAFLSDKKATTFRTPVVPSIAEIEAVIVEDVKAEQEIVNPTLLIPCIVDGASIKSEPRTRQSPYAKYDGLEVGQAIINLTYALANGIKGRLTKKGMRLEKIKTGKDQYALKRTV